MGWTGADVSDQTDKVAIVTGSNSGIGYEMAKALARAKAHVIVAARSEDKGNAAVASLKEELGDVNVEFMKLDLASSTSITAFVDAFMLMQLPLHILINNAGVAFIEQGKTEDGYETVVGVNHFGTFLLTNLLLDVLKKSAPARVVSVASDVAKLGIAHLDDLKGEHIEKYDAMAVYATSKLYTVMFAQELDRRLEGTNVRSFVVHPGTVKTAIFGKMDDGLFMTKLMRYMIPIVGQTPEHGAISALWCATSDEPLKTGTQVMYGPKLLGGPLMLGNYWNTSHEAVTNKEVTPENNLKLWETTERIVFAA